MTNPGPLRAPNLFFQPIPTGLFRPFFAGVFRKTFLRPRIGGSRGFALRKTGQFIAVTAKDRDPGLVSDNGEQGPENPVPGSGDSGTMPENNRSAIFIAKPGSVFLPEIPDPTVTYLPITGRIPLTIIRN